MALGFGQPWQVALEESFRSVLKAHDLMDAHAEACRGDAEPTIGGKSTPYTRALARCVAALRDRVATALAEFDATIETHVSELDTLRGGSRLLVALPSAHSGYGVDSSGHMHAAWMAEATATEMAVPRDVMPERISDCLAAPPTSVVGTGVRAQLTSRLDARVRSRVAAMHRMALRAFAKAAAEAVAPETHPEAPACLRKASTMAPPPPLSAHSAAAAAALLNTSAPAVLRRSGRPTAHSRAILKAWMNAHVLPSASHPHGPFPTAAEKAALADETGLSVNQVNDWFINARARWWKPLVEGMHAGLVTGDGPAAFSAALLDAAQPLPAVSERDEEAPRMSGAKGRHVRQRSVSRAPVSVLDSLAHGGTAPLRRRCSGMVASRDGSAASKDLGSVIDALGLGDGSL